MASYNRVILMGNLTRDIELKYTPGGTAVTDAGLAVNNKRKNQDGEWVDEVCFVDVTLWGRTAEVASEYLTKGSPVFIEGHLKFDSWETDGQKRSKLRVVCDRMQLVGGGSSRGGQTGQSSYGGGQAGGGSTQDSRFKSASHDGGSAHGASASQDSVAPAAGRGDAQPSGSGDAYNDPDIPF
ncbi:MAG: single-stranded DNA-binding protein [Planctomycetota bacterium]